MTEQNNEVIGYKGFKLVKGKLMCRDLQYEIGKQYVLAGDLKVCGSGFHFCKNLKDVNAYYPFAHQDNVFYRVKASGIIDDHFDGTKTACSRIEVLDKISRKEIIMHLLDEHMANVDKVLQANPNIVISGSLALILRGIIPYRDIKDYDFTLPYFTSFGNGIDNSFGASGEECIQMSVGTVLFDLFVNPLNLYDIISYRGKEYKVSRVINIINAKWRYMNEGKMKHGNDIKSYINFLSQGYDETSANHIDWNSTEIENTQKDILGSLESIEYRKGREIKESNEEWFFERA